MPQPTEIDASHQTPWTSRPLIRITQLAVTWPWQILFICTLFALGAVWLTCTRLEMRTSRLDLLNPDSDYNRRWIEYLNEFDHQDDLIVVVHGDDQASVLAAIDRVAGQMLERPDLFANVLYRIDLSHLRKKGLFYLPEPALRQLEAFVSTCEPLLRGEWTAWTIQNQLVSAAERLRENPPGTSGDPSSGRFDQLLDGLASATQGMRPRDAAAAHEATGFPSQLLDYFQQPQYLTSNEGKYAFIQAHLSLTNPGEGLARGTRAIATLRELVQTTSQQFPQLKMGVTGLPVMENDEMRTSQQDMAYSSWISLVGVAAVFIIGFGNLRYPLISVAVLMVAMVWCFGFTALAVGHLNILSVSFGAILIGLGIDFGIHYVAQYLQVRPHRAEADEALLVTAARVGPGVVSGGMTTAAAFATTAFTDFPGVAELGIIAAGGILICVAVTVLLLPAAIVLLERNFAFSYAHQPLPIDHWVHGWLRSPRTIIVGTVALTAIVGLGISELWYDHNLLNLQSPSLESVAIEQHLLRNTDRGAWHAVSVSADRQTLMARKQAFAALDSVDHVEEIASLIPLVDPAKLDWIARLSNRLASIPAHTPELPVLEQESLVAQLATMEQALPTRSAAGQVTLAKLRDVRQRIAQLPKPAYFQVISAIQQQLAEHQLTALRQLQSIADPHPPQNSDLPPALSKRFLSPRGLHALHVYAKGSIWDMQALQQFVHDVEKIDARITGQPIQTYYASRQMQRGYITAALYSLVAVIVIVFLDFWSITDMVLALLPMLAGMALLLGIMGWLNIPLNPANMIVLPLILGLGVDNGVHIMHEYRARTAVFSLRSSTASAVVMNSLTNIVGFGCLMLSDHRGLYSLGLVLAIGMACCLVTSLISLPALLMLRSPAPRSPTHPGRQGPLNRQRHPDRSLVH